MNKRTLTVLGVLCACCPIAANCEETLQDQILTAQIGRLETECDEKYAKLKECESKTKKFKIAGGISLAMTSVGLGVNIALASQRASLSGGAGGRGLASTPTNNEPQSVKDCKSLKELYAIGLATPEEANC